MLNTIHLNGVFCIANKASRVLEIILLIVCKFFDAYVNKLLKKI